MLYCWETCLVNIHKDLHRSLMSMYLHCVYTEKWKSFSMGYKEFMGGLFDENLTFLEGIIHSL